MLVEKIEVEIAPGFSENCYLLSESARAESVMVVDPGAQCDKIIAAIGNHNVLGIILTHRHYDHLGAVHELVQHLQAQEGNDHRELKIFAHPSEAKAISQDIPRPFGRGGKLEAICVDCLVNEGDNIALGNTTLQVLLTPGHTDGSICLYEPISATLIAGDTIFYRALGRTDLPSGSSADQLKTVKRLAKLANQTIVYPGHDANTSIGFEKISGVLRGL